MSLSGMAPRLDDYIRHMYEASTQALDYVARLSKEQFLQDRKTQQAVIYNIMIIGEAATKISAGYPEFVDAHKEIPWREMRGIRNRMAHGYFEIDLNIIWDTVILDLKKLADQLKPLLTS